MAYVIGGDGNYNKLAKFKADSGLDIRKWCSDESNFWGQITNSIGNNVSSDTADAISQYIRGLRTLLNSSEITMEDIYRLAWEYKLPFHDEEVAPRVLGYSLNPNLFEPAIFAYQLSISAEINAYNRLYTDRFETIDQIQSDRIDSAIMNFAAEKDTAIKAIETVAESMADDLEKKLSAASAAIALSEPVQFWENRKETHEEKAREWGKRAITAALVFLGILALLIVYEYGSGETYTVKGLTFTVPQNKFGIALLILFTSAGIWMVRIFIKLMMANLTLEAESLERSTMIKSFVAMKAVSGDIDKENQTLFYTTLFRPTTSSLTEDGTAPELARLVEVILKKN